MRLEFHAGGRFLDKLKLALLGPIYIIIILLWLTNSKANEATLDRGMRSVLHRLHSTLLSVLNSSEDRLILVHVL